jgi:hypothetical protein
MPIKSSELGNCDELEANTAWKAACRHWVQFWL